MILVYNLVELTLFEKKCKKLRMKSESNSARARRTQEDKKEILEDEIERKAQDEEA